MKRAICCGRAHADGLHSGYRARQHGQETSCREVASCGPPWQAHAVFLSGASGIAGKAINVRC
jgi:hypothetical protein